MNRHSDESRLRRGLYRRSIIVLVIGLLLSPASIPIAHAATYTVTKSDDSNDGTCDTDCSLREAIIAANATPGSDSITLPSGTFVLTISGTFEDLATTGDLDITDSLTLVGAGITQTIIDGGAIDRVIDVLGSTTEVTLSAITIQNGSVHTYGGGIANEGILTLGNCAVKDNLANGGGGIVAGGGIGNAGTLTLNNSTISNNTANNATANGGGGISNSGSGTLVLTDSTISGNTTNVFGGGIFNTGSADLVNTTITDNGAGTGGGIWNAGTADLLNITITDNSASTGGGITGFFGSVTLKNTIAANSTSGGNCSGTVASEGNNLDSGTTCGFTGPGDMSNTDPLLGPLQNNGGFTSTHALLAGSPAVDAGDDVNCPATDQRGVTRPQGIACDIGAYEFAVYAYRVFLPLVLKSP